MKPRPIRLREEARAELLHEVRYYESVNANSNSATATTNRDSCGKLHPSTFHSLVNAMSLPLEALESEVLRLPTADRVKLLDRVVASLDADSARDAAWDAVAGRRDAEIESELAIEVPVDDVLARLRTELL